MAVILIEVGGVDITPDVVFKECEFVSMANGRTGAGKIRVRDDGHTYAFTAGVAVRVAIDGTNVWRGFLSLIQRVYPFPQMDTTTPTTVHRYFDLTCNDINILFEKRVVFHKSQPTDMLGAIYNADVPDSQAIALLVSDYLDLTGDGIDTSTFIETVGNINAGQPARPFGASVTWGQAMQQISMLPAAVYYIDPDKNLVYTDVDTPNAASALVDYPPSIANSVGYRDMEIINDGGSLANDYLAWGLAQAPAVFARRTDATSVALHGLWQDTRVDPGIYKQTSIDRVAQTAVYGSPSSKRGRKDDRLSVRLTTFADGFRVAQKARVVSSVYNFDQVLPIRQTRITFPIPEQPKYELLLSHEIDPPWGFFDPIRIKLPPNPNIDPPPPPPPPPPGECDDSICLDLTVIDDFNRSLGSGWGDASSGPTWSTSSSPVAPAFDFSVAASHGRATTDSLWGFSNGSHDAFGSLSFGTPFSFAAYDLLSAVFRFGQSLDSVYNGWNGTPPATFLMEQFMRVAFGSLTVFLSEGHDPLLGLQQTSLSLSGAGTFANHTVSGNIITPGVDHSVLIELDHDLHRARVSVPSLGLITDWSDFTGTTFSTVSVSCGREYSGSGGQGGTPNLSISEIVFEFDQIQGVIDRCATVQFDDFERVDQIGWDVATDGHQWANQYNLGGGLFQIVDGQARMGTHGFNAGSPGQGDYRYSYASSFAVSGPTEYWLSESFTFRTVITIVEFDYYTLHGLDTGDTVETSHGIFCGPGPEFGSHPSLGFLLRFAVGTGSQYVGDVGVGLFDIVVGAAYTTSPRSFSVGDRLNVRYELTWGNQHRVKVWDVGTAEPSDWDVTQAAPTQAAYLNDAGDESHWVVTQNGGYGYTSVHPERQVVDFEWMDFDYDGRPCYYVSESGNCFDAPDWVDVQENGSSTATLTGLSAVLKTYSNRWFNGVIRLGTTDPSGHPGQYLRARFSFDRLPPTTPANSTMTLGFGYGGISAPTFTIMSVSISPTTLFVRAGAASFVSVGTAQADVEYTAECDLTNLQARVWPTLETPPDWQSIVGGALDLETLKFWVTTSYFGEIAADDFIIADIVEVCTYTNEIGVLIPVFPSGGTGSHDPGGVGCEIAARLSSTTFQTSQSFVRGTTEVYVNGVFQRPGFEYDESPSNDRLILMSVGLGSDDTVRICYVTASTATFPGYTPSEIVDCPDLQQAIAATPTGGTLDLGTCVFNDEEVTISRAMTILGGKFIGGGIQSSQSYVGMIITASNVKVIGSEFTNYWRAMRVLAADDVEIRNVDLHDLGRTGIEIHDAAVGIKIISAVIQRTGLAGEGNAEGIYVGSARSATSWDHPDYVRNGEIAYCTISAQGDGIDVKDDTYGFLIHHNDVSGCQEAAGGAINIRGHDHYIYNNVSHDNVSSGFRFGGTPDGVALNYVYDNQAHNNDEYGYKCVDSPQHQFTGNTGSGNGFGLTSGC